MGTPSWICAAGAVVCIVFFFSQKCFSALHSAKRRTTLVVSYCTVGVDVDVFSSLLDLVLFKNGHLCGGRMGGQAPCELSGAVGILL